MRVACGLLQVRNRLTVLSSIVEGITEFVAKLRIGGVLIDTLLTLDKALIKPVTTTNAGQAALRPLDSGLKLDKLSAALPGWKPRTVKEAINDWLDNPMGLPLGQ